jgi:iron complex transport system ATP-binding protein
LAARSFFIYCAGRASTVEDKSLLEAKNISVKYGTRDALFDVSVRVTPGRLTAILGPNGAGKSTLMRALTGAVELSSGEVLLANRNIRDWPRREVARRIGVVAQESELRFPVTVMEFVLGARYATASPMAVGWETDEDVEISTAALRETSMLEYATRLMNELSGGERQRAVLTRALATGAAVLLLDEPTANLDLARQASMLTLVRERCDRCECAAVVVTHDVNLAAEFADEVLLLKNGRIAGSGSPKDVLTEKLLREVFDIEVLVDRHPISGVPRITPVHGPRR